MTTKHHHNRGIIAIVAVLIITAIITFVGLSIALMGVNEIQRGDVRLAGVQAGYLTSACVENALLVLRNNNSTTGNVNINVSNVNCIATIAGSGNTRTIEARATTTDSFGAELVGRTNTNVNIATNPFTILQYKDILE